MDGKTLVEFIQEYKNDLIVSSIGFEMKLTFKGGKNIPPQEQARYQEIGTKLDKIFEYLECCLGRDSFSDRWVARSRSWNGYPNTLNKTIKESKKEELRLIEELNKEREIEFESLKEKISPYVSNVERLHFKLLELSLDCYDCTIDRNDSFMIMKLSENDEVFYPDLKKAGYME